MIGVALLIWLILLLAILTGLGSIIVGALAMLGFVQFSWSSSLMVGMAFWVIALMFRSNRT